MRWLKRDIWKAGIALAGLLLLFVLMVWIPVSAAGAYEGTSGLATSVMARVQATPTVDLTVTALAKEQLALQVKQLQNQLEDQNNWFANNSTALIAAVATVVVALFGILQWAITVRQAQDKDLKDRDNERRKEITAQEKELKDKQAAHDKDLRAHAEERFQAAVTALGDENEATQIGGAILLRSFLNSEDTAIYGRYYTQIFDLAVAYLRPSSTYYLSEDPNVPVPLTPLRRALIIVFKEAFPRTRGRLKRNIQFLDATGVLLDNAYLSEADLKQAWMRESYLRNADLSETELSAAELEGANLFGANLHRAKLEGANLWGANLADADLSWTRLSGAYLSEAKLNGAKLTLADLVGARIILADLREAKLEGADLTMADLRRAKLNGANLFRTKLNGAELEAADLTMATLREANPEDALSLKDTDLRGVKGLTKEQLETCKAKGAIIDEDTTTDSSQSSFAPPTPSQSNNAQSPSAQPTQVNTPPPSTDGSSSASSQPSAEP